MKRKIGVGLCFVVTTMALAGCGADTKDENIVYEEDVAVILRDEVTALSPTSEEMSTEAVTQVVEESVMAEEIRVPEIQITPIEEVWYTEDGIQVLMTATSSKVEVTNEGYDVLSQALDEWSGVIYNEILATAEEFASWATEQYTLLEQPEYFASYYTKLELIPKRVDENIVSFGAVHSMFSGGAHGNHASVGYTFDVDTGEIITLDRLIADDEAFQTVAIEEILKVLASEEYAADVFPDYEATVRGAFAQEGYLSWYLSEEGIVITFDPYEVAPYSMGVVEITLPYEQFEQYMALKYRPN